MEPMSKTTALKAAKARFKISLNKPIGYASGYVQLIEDGKKVVCGSYFDGEVKKARRYEVIKHALALMGWDTGGFDATWAKMTAVYQCKSIDKLFGHCLDHLEFVKKTAEATTQD